MNIPYRPFFGNSRLAGSNRGPTVYKTVALPTELRRQMGRIGIEPMKAQGQQIYSLPRLTASVPARKSPAGGGGYDFNGADDRDRTDDLVLTMDALYQLSYVGLILPK